MKRQIETKRAILRPVKISDAEEIFEYAKDYETGPRAGWEPHKSIEDTINIIKMWLSPESTEEQFVIILKEENKIIGTTGITYLNKHLKTSKNHVALKIIEQGANLWEIGITIARNYWGKGIATEVINGLINYLFEEREADVVMATHSDQNIGSLKAQEKNGLKVLGEYDCGQKWYNTNSTIHIVRAKTKDEWLKEKNELTKS